MQLGNPKRQGFAQIPNAVIDNPALCPRDKLVLIKLASHAYGKSTTAKPSHAKIARELGYRRETVRAATDSLTALGILRPHGKGRKGTREHYTIDLDRVANLTSQSSSNLTTQSSGPDESVVIKHTAQEYEKKKTHADPEVTSKPDGAARGGLDGISGNALLSQDEGPDNSLVRFTKRQINDLLLAPDGKRPDLDGLESDLCEVLLQAESPKHFDSRQLDRLVEDHGMERCAFWASWLLRKIAAEYEAGRPVQNPAGLYRRAVEQHWEVDPSWPPFDELRHTDAAWKIKHGIGDEEGLYHGDPCPF